jgi:crotonobetainyl-CoA:carnitine CoA-transferase CaiB-like acyl-CoA transferase
MSYPLEGVRILDLSRLLPGPYATQMLGDMGAEVIKIEQPGVGDYMRDQEPSVPGGDSHVFSILNRNKRSVSLDLKDERGREAFLALAEDADAILDGFRPGVCERLGIGYDAVRERNDSIVYCSLTGYGQRGPYEQWAGHDINYIGIGGLLGMTGDPDGNPTVPGLPIADFAGGMMAALALMFGLYRAAATGEGDYYDVPMTDTIVSWMELYAGESLNPDGETPERGGTLPAGKFPCYNVYETADGRYITLGAMEFHFWENFCTEVGLEEYVNPVDHMPEGDRLAEIEAAVADVFARRSRDEWLDRFDPAEVPVAPVNDLDEVWEDPQVLERDLLSYLEIDGEDVALVDNPIDTREKRDWIREPHPGLGEHTRELLAETGLSGAEIEELAADGVIDEP